MFCVTCAVLCMFKQIGMLYLDVSLRVCRDLRRATRIQRQIVLFRAKHQAKFCALRGYECYNHHVYALSLKTSKIVGVTGISLCF